MPTTRKTWITYPTPGTFTGYDNEAIYPFEDNPVGPGGNLPADLRAEGATYAPRALDRLERLVYADGEPCQGRAHRSADEAPLVGWIIEDGERGFTQRYEPFAIVDTGDEALLSCMACLDELG